MKAIIGRKMGMTQVFAEDGTKYPVTVIEVLPNVVTQIKTKEKDGYDAIQVGYEDKKVSPHNLTKPLKGHYEKAGVAPKKALRELKVDNVNDYKLGQEITVDIFEDGDVIDVRGLTKGKGFTGAVKRWNYSIGPAAHGSGYHRGPGSMANNGVIPRMQPGKKMAGHHGHKYQTILNLQIVKVLKDKNAILVKGSVPGPNQSIVSIRSAVKAQLKERKVKPLATASK